MTTPSLSPAVRPTADGPSASRAQPAVSASARRGHSAPRRGRGALEILVCAAVLLSAALARAQPQRPAPHVGYAYPAGGQLGTTFTLTVGGQNLNGTTEAYVTGAGISTRVTGFDRPMTQKEFNDLREKAQALQERRAAALGLPVPERKDAKKLDPEKKAPAAAATEPLATPAASAATKPTWTPEDQKRLEELRAQLMAKRPNRQGNPAIAETVTVEVTIAPDAAVGDCELRLKSPGGLSNPLRLEIGQLPEFTKPVVTATSLPPPPRPGKPAANAGSPRGPTIDAEVSLPVTLNGQILPGGVDRYRFTAAKGQHLTVAVSARALIPYLADAVPGWFQATIGLYDASGHELAYSDSYRFSPDPVLTFEIPADGRYALEIKDSIYRGREDFVYRISVGELPFVTGIFPLGGRPDDHPTFELSGWNLPVRTLTLDPTEHGAGTFLVSVHHRGQLSNAVRVALDEIPAVREAEPNDTPATAQWLTLPVVVDGRIGQAGDQDVFRFQGKAGAEVVAEVFARRLGSPLDSLLRITNERGEQLALNDDHEDKGAGMMTHHADSRISLTLPADGTYFVHLTDTQGHSGPEYAYRLRVSPPHPDFELRVAPSSLVLRAGGAAPVTVYALRRDGFTGEIAVSLDANARDFTLSGARIPAGQDKVQFTITAPANHRTDDLVRLNFLGVALINGTPVARNAVPADDMMQAFAYHHLVTASEMLANVLGRAGPTPRALTRGPVQVPLGGSVTLRFEVPAPRAIDQRRAELVDAPEGVTIAEATSDGDRLTIVLACDRAKAKVGARGNLIFAAIGERTNPNAKGAQRTQRIPLGIVPAIPFEITAPPIAGDLPH